MSLWDIDKPGKAPQGVSRPQEPEVRAVAFSPTDGKTLISAGYDSTLRFWNLSQPEEKPRMIPVAIPGHDIESRRLRSASMAECWPPAI